MLVIAAPGQGAQAPGLSPWLELPGFAERLGGWSSWPVST
jgi:[acyl-carrier-protein] S-malonyltransferase